MVSLWVMAKTGIGVRPENRCHGISKKTGERCRAAKVTLTTVDGEVKRYKLCLGHLLKAVGPAKIEERFGIKLSGNRGGRRPRKPSAIEMLRHKAEEEYGTDAILAPYFEGLTAERALVVGNGPSAFVEMVPDIELSMKATDRILDRVYGKARQAMELTGAGGGAIQIDVPTDEERAAQVAKMLAMTGGLRTPVNDLEDDVASTNGSTNGHRNGNG